MTSSDASSTIRAVGIGAAAWRAAASACRARVLGSTTGGVFLLAPPQQIIFVSFERYRSPLTINLDRSFDRLRAIDVAATAQFSTARLIFPSIEFSISLSEEMVWQCLPPDRAARPPVEQRQIVQAIAQRVLVRRGDAGLAVLLPILLERPAAPPLSDEQSALLDRLIALRRAVQADDNSALRTGLTGLLGQGRGLTPSGDDVVIGLLLMLARSPRVNTQAGNSNMLKHVAVAVVTEAYQRTTSISANLIECAAAGQGDERLITVADGIATGSTSIDECAEYVLGWGSSSGIDVLVGMAVAVDIR